MLAKHVQAIVVSLTVAAITAAAGVLWAQSSRITALETNQTWMVETMREIKADIQLHHSGGTHQPPRGP
jgi:hypothetical protein